MNSVQFGLVGMLLVFCLSSMSESLTVSSVSSSRNHVTVTCGRPPFPVVASTTVSALSKSRCDVGNPDDLDHARSLVQ